VIGDWSLVNSDLIVISVHWSLLTVHHIR